MSGGKADVGKLSCDFGTKDSILKIIGKDRLAQKQPELHLLYQEIYHQISAYIIVEIAKIRFPTKMQVPCVWGGKSAK